MKLILGTSLSLGTGLLSASLLVTPTAITYTNSPNQEVGGLNLDDENNLINGNGLSAIPDFATYTTVTHTPAGFTAPGNAWATVDPGGAASDFFATGGEAPVFEMTLDQTYALTDFVYWGYFFSGTNGNEAREFVVEFSQDGGTTFPETVTVAAELGDLAGEFAKTLPFGEIYNANALRISVTDNHFDGGATEGGGDRVGLAEIRFLATEGGGEPLAVTGFEVSEGLAQITSVSGLKDGATYHLETGTTLQDFAPVPGSDFTSASPVFPTVEATTAARFLRVVEGPAPGN
jgi:hypothetical protein